MGTVTIGATNYTVYGDATGLDAYWQAGMGDGYTAWSAADATKRKRSLVAATRLLDRQPWQGDPVGTPVIDTVLQWPRTGITDVSSASVPDEVEKACYELAGAIMADESLTTNATSGSNVKRVKAASVEVEFFTNTLGISGKLPQSVSDLVGQWLLGAGSGSSSAISYGTDGTEESQFDGTDTYTLTEPHS